MDRAIVLEHGRETIVFAEEYASGYKKAYARSTKFLCPCCGQKLYFAGGNTQAPHFRHEKNNPYTKQCELYVSAGMGGETLPVRVPPPLFIRQKVGMPGTFVIELGLKSPQEPTLSTLEKEGAVLSVANGMLRPKEYKVTAERFASGLFRVPLRVGRDFSFDGVRLTHSERKFAEVWGMPEPIEDVLFFSCDRQTLSGRRIGSSGRIAIDDSVLIVSEFDTSYFSDFFSDIEKVGHAQACSSGSLNVFIATVGGASVDLLAKHEIVLTSRAEVPELLWPPALTSSGETRPLFSRSDCLYRLKHPSGGPEAHETLYVRSDTTTDADALRLERTCGKQWGSACVHLSSDVTFITTDAWGPTLGILLKRKENQEEGLRDSGMLPHIERLESGEFEVSALFPCKVIRLCKGGHIERIGLEPGTVQVIPNESRELVRIVLDATLGMHGNRIVFELVPDVVEAVSSCRESQQLKQPVGLGRDMAFARSRAVLIHSIDAACDLRFAAIRKA